jgi:NTP pyrophosphatase (non-canonical NTP hydrolase)
MQRLIDELRNFRDERDWRKFHTAKDLSISLCVEAAELLEIFQWHPAEAQPSPDQLRNARREVADVLIYLIYLCDALEIDILEAARAKVRENAARFGIADSKGIAKRPRIGKDNSSV